MTRLAPHATSTPHGGGGGADRAFEVPDRQGVALHHMVAVSLGGGQGSIQHIVNDTGGPADQANAVAYLTEYGG